MTTPQPGLRQLNLLWFTVLAAPMMIGIAIALMVWVGNYQASMQLMPTDTLRMAAMGAMALTLVVARPLRDALMTPQAMAQRPIQGSTGHSPAVMKVQASMFILLGVLDFVAVAIVALSLMHADAMLALLNGVYGLVLAVIARPDFATLIERTEQQLKRAS
ncbi:MAG: hypothetical protein MI745_10610 [Pseudomonadales bacterium]|nr:hypothetical protein [Pseudomonadales bacterium]